MTKVQAHTVFMSVDGFSAGPDQDIDNPLGVGGPRMVEWFMATKCWKEMQGQAGGSEGIDNKHAEAGFVNVGAHIMGRNMFGPIRGDWGDESWKGWWGPNPPYHHATYVLTNYARDPIEMEGGTTFYFVTEGIEAALKLAQESAGDQNIRIGGGVNTIQQYLAAGLIDDLFIAQAPVLLGAGERLFDNLGDAIDSYKCVNVEQGEGAVHLHFTRS